MNKAKSDRIIFIIFILNLFLKLIIRDILGIISYNNIFSTGISAFIEFGLLLFLSKEYLICDYKTKFLKLKKRTIIKLFLFMGIFNLLSSIIVKKLFLIINKSNAVIPINESIINTLQQSYPVLIFVISCIMAPVIEEYVFRDILYKFFARKNVLFSIIITGIIFGLVHMIPSLRDVPMTIILIQSISYITIGLYLGYVRYKYNSIMLTIILHSLHNIFAYLMHLLVELI